MVRDITIGQYYPVESVIHRLDPRTKLVYTFLYIISLFLANNRYMFLLSAVFLIVYILISKVPVSYMLKGIKGILLFILASVVINMFFTKGDPFLTLGIVHISWQGFRTAIFTMARILMLVLGSSVLTYTTTPTKLTDGLEKGLRWMNRWKIPVHEISMMIGIALRFIPILVEELNKIMKAQQARGADFEQGSVFRRLKNMVPIFVPMFVSAIRRANDLASAMEARCYQGGEGRTKLHPLNYTAADGIAYLLLLVYMAGMITIRLLYTHNMIEQLENVQVPLSMIHIWIL